ncbi:MAG TPA: CHAT domain-containing tetratricopeptide repeat protein [Streptosporangiaceae bacterium]|nr:CHAT domain-containing tetratricopeptide repeat protein [Streptosporangiaceae bacterium]
MALARPKEALAGARGVLAGNPSLWDASVARHVVGIVLRDFGDVNAAIGELTAALRLARAAGSNDREADVLATLGTALVLAGRTESGLTNLNAAVGKASGVPASRVLVRRGGTLRVLGRHQEALRDLRRAVTVLRRAGDAIWEARALTHLALTHLALGSTERADADFEAAEHLWAATSQELESVYTVHNRALVAFRSGDLPAALSYLDQAARRYESLAVRMPEVNIDRCAVLLAAGLTRDALAEADLAIRDVERIRGQATKKAELLLTAAGAALAADDPQAALQRAQAACRLFGAQQRAWWHARATLLLLQARFATGVASTRLLRDAERAATRLDALGSDEAAQARLLAGRVALALGRAQDADRNLAVAALIRRRRGPALSRANGWLAEALRAEAAGNSRRLLNACRRGSDLLCEYFLTFGASELRAQATARGAELAEIAQRHALRSGRPRLLLDWSERWRATALAVPPVLPVDDHELRTDLAAVRDVMSRVEKAQAGGMPAAALQREQLRLESAIRARAMRARGAGGTHGRGTHGRGTHRRSASGDGRFDADVLLGELGAVRLIQIVSIGGQLHLVVCDGGRVRHVAAGQMAEAAREIDFARFGLNRLAHSRHLHEASTGQPGGALAVLEATGHRLERILLGAASAHLGDGPVVLVPPGRLHAVPWALLPSLRHRVVSVAPSARAWLRTRAAVPPERPAVVLVRGPGAGTWGAEVPALAAEYGNATMLGGDGSATAPRVLGAIDGAGLVHIAAHGEFRADSPLFSSLRMDDGPLTVHDFERLRRAPYRVILPSCDSGLLAPAGADELLGLASTLVPLGTAGIVASVVRVNDKAVVELMLALHRRLRRGGNLSEALRDARAEQSGDPVQAATGWSFIALGAG